MDKREKEKTDSLDSRSGPFTLSLVSTHLSCCRLWYLNVCLFAFFFCSCSFGCSLVSQESGLLSTRPSSPRSKFFFLYLLVPSLGQTSERRAARGVVWHGMVWYDGGIVRQDKYGGYDVSTAYTLPLPICLSTSPSLSPQNTHIPTFQTKLESMERSKRDKKKGS